MAFTCAGKIYEVTLNDVPLRTYSINVSGNKEYFQTITNKEIPSKKN